MFIFLRQAWSFNAPGTAVLTALDRSGRLGRFHAGSDRMKSNKRSAATADVAGDPATARLKAFLSAPARPEDTLCYEQLLGFLFAIGSAPELIPPSEWLPLVFGDNEAGYENPDEAREILESIMALYNHINKEIVDGDPALPDSCALLPDVMANLEPEAPLSLWSNGFAAGHGFVEELWDEYTPEALADEFGTILMVLTFFSSQKLAQAYHDEFDTIGRSLAEAAAAVLELFPAAMQSYAHMGRSIYLTLLEQQGPAAPVVKDEKTGRNAPCPCGSGKKYKKCCGASERLH